MMTKKKIGISVVTFARGNRIRYAPRTPAIAPDAPIEGSVDDGFANACVNAAMNLKQILPGYSGSIMGQPEIYLNGVGDAFNDKGALVKESMQTVMKQYIDAFAAFVQKHNT